MKASKHTETEGSRQQRQENPTTPLVINCSSGIYHSTSSIPVEGEYRVSLKDCLITSGSSSETPVSTSNKVELATTFADFCPRPLALVERGARRALVFHEALAPHFLFSVGAAEIRGGSSVRAGTTYLQPSNKNQTVHVNE
jgi:hypothetical protein